MKEETKKKRKRRNTIEKDTYIFKVEMYKLAISKIYIYEFSKRVARKCVDSKNNFGHKNDYYESLYRFSMHIFVFFFNRMGP